MNADGKAAANNREKHANGKYLQGSFHKTDLICSYVDIATSDRILNAETRRNSLRCNLSTSHQIFLRVSAFYFR